MRPVSLALAGLLLLLAAPGSRADHSIAPPGNSGVDQYRETIPSPTGDRIAGGPPGARSALGTTTMRALRERGADGRDAARAFRSTAPPSPSRRRPSAPPVATGGESVARTVLTAASGTGAGGPGLLLPALLGGTLLGAAAFTLSGRRRRRG